MSYLLRYDFLPKEYHNCYNVLIRFVFVPLLLFFYNSFAFINSLHESQFIYK
jgi:hypothetical protein